MCDEKELNLHHLPLKCMVWICTQVYASEILGIVLQNSEHAREELLSLDLVCGARSVVASWVMRDP